MLKAGKDMKKGTALQNIGRSNPTESETGPWHKLNPVPNSKHWAKWIPLSSLSSMNDLARFCVGGFQNIKGKRENWRGEKY